uniref:PARP catalytic domain-containing protein n=2 Tax=Phaeomonas parva TaxID=124430 RepID=A0A7S1TZV1_9STRA|mmetsp:Transcript_24969/g.78189  ORF Transcript_24969/g.78189 Transcript_24969/m.78189 type:complete len:374 (+) Transcript_24969:288-1409(+)
MRARATARSDEDWRYEALRRGVPPLALQGADIGAFFQWFVHDGTRPLHPGLFVGLATVFRALRESGFGVLSIENIMREDLAVKFLHHWMELAERYGSRRNRNVHPPSRSHRRGTVRWPYQGGCGAFTWRAGDAEPGAPCAQPIMAFHGTQQHRFASIVRNGLVVPGRNVGHRHDAGYYGRGIYVSPDAGTSAGYAAGNSQLIVCATLLGNAYVATQSRNMYGAAKMQDYDSHTSEDGWNELVLFRNEQVLPCWMVTFCALDARPEIVKGDVHTIADSGTIYKTGEQYAGASNADGVAELSREELQRRAAFWFTSLDGKKKRQILEVAEPDDDDDTVSGFDRGTVDLERDGVLLEDGEHALHRQLPRGFGDDRW